MPNDHLEQVRAFMLAMGQDAPFSPKIPDTTIRALRRKLIREEKNEFDDATFLKPTTYPATQDLTILVEVADALADLLYVVYGASVAYGIDIHSIFDIVHRCNMKKLTGSVREDGKKMKPEGWIGPEEAIRKELERQIFVNEKQNA